MSTGARVTIGIATLLATVGFAVTGATLGPELPAGPLPFYGLAAFSGVVAAACFFRRGRSLMLRIIGTVICGGYAVYAYDSYGGENFPRALMGFFVIGVPCGYLAIAGRYPTWGRWSAAFEGPQSTNSEPPADEPRSSTCSAQFPPVQWARAGCLVSWVGNPSGCGPIDSSVPRANRYCSLSVVFGPLQPATDNWQLATNSDGGLTR